MPGRLLLLGAVALASCGGDGSGTDGALGDLAHLGDLARLADLRGSDGPRDAAPPTVDQAVDQASADLAAPGCGYTTAFAGVENPLSENGAWVTGGVTGLDWQDPAKDNGLAYASATSAGYNDCVAHVKGCGAAQFAQATLHVQQNYNPGVSHEIELLLRFQITAHVARGYEINCGWNGAYSQIVRWNGKLNDFTYLNPNGPGFGALKEGDVIRATAVGSTITVYKNGQQVMQVDDATWADGEPGMGFFVRPGNQVDPKAYCFKDYSAGAM
jgi:hypothetical protein